MGSVVRSKYRPLYRDVGAASTLVAWALEPVRAFKREENFLTLLGNEPQFLNHTFFAYLLHRLS